MGLVLLESGRGYVALESGLGSVELEARGPAYVPPLAVAWLYGGASRVEALSASFSSVAWLYGSTSRVAGLAVPDYLVDDLPSPIISIASPIPDSITWPVSGQLVDAVGVGISQADLLTFTLTLFDTMSGAIVDDVSQADILNTGRGTVDDEGNFVVTLTADDTSTGELPGATMVQRSMVLDWSTSSFSGRQQVNFWIEVLGGP